MGTRSPLDRSGSPSGAVRILIPIIVVFVLTDPGSARYAVGDDIGGRRAWSESGGRVLLGVYTVRGFYVDGVGATSAARPARTRS